MKPDPWKLTVWRRPPLTRGDHPLQTAHPGRLAGAARRWPGWALAALVGTGGWQAWQGLHLSPGPGDGHPADLVTVTPDPRQPDGLVWLNLASGVYHQPGCRYYETSGKGLLVPLDEARQHGRACQACLARLPENRRAPVPARDGRAFVLP